MSVASENLPEIHDLGAYVNPYSFNLMCNFHGKSMDKPCCNVLVFVGLRVDDFVESSMQPKQCYRILYGIMT